MVSAGRLFAAASVAVMASAFALMSGHPMAVIAAVYNAVVLARLAVWCWEAAS